MVIERNVNPLPASNMKFCAIFYHSLTWNLCALLLYVCLLWIICLTLFRTSVEDILTYMLSMDVLWSIHIIILLEQFLFWYLLHQNEKGHHSMHCTLPKPSTSNSEEEDRKSKFQERNIKKENINSSTKVMDKFCPLFFHLDSSTYWQFGSAFFFSPGLIRSIFSWLGGPWSQVKYLLFFYSFCFHDKKIICEVKSV